MNEIIIEQTKEILNEEDLLAALCNLSALLNEVIDDINWLGFYFLKNNELVLGPFQGKVACTHLKLSKGVCAHAFNTKKIVRVDNVHVFASHIACDARTNSEIVAPLFIDDKCIGVLDIDSISYNRFNLEDEILISKIADLISKRIKKDYPKISN